MNIKDIKARLALNEVPFLEELPEKLYIYLELLREWNSRMDLTAVTDDEETVDKHFVDSLTVLKTGLIKGSEKLIDVGTGAGFPGLVLAMACPELKVTLLDSQQKRLSFLQAVSEKSEVTNVILVHARAEDGARKKELREQFDIAAARALAPMNVLCEYLLPYAAVDGCALCWKGPALQNELESGRKAAHLLGGRIEMPVECPVYGREWEHMILPIRKVQHTASIYPRKAGVPKSKPLGI
ncbi:MAG: 16S rRNA (guanine(527)-N(7))-methyltransferase RsmG [Clostridia bacterium]|nr:16S rRNA (guanine(527)-N(7))-methyltransferase RsmG [Clostridia bacterium]